MVDKPPNWCLHWIFPFTVRQGIYAKTLGSLGQTHHSRNRWKLPSLPQTHTVTCGKDIRLCSGQKGSLNRYHHFRERRGFLNQKTVQIPNITSNLSNLFHQNCRPKISGGALRSSSCTGQAAKPCSLANHRLGSSCAYGIYIYIQRYVYTASGWV